jgi:gliding motility-associated-like protein
LGCKDSITVPVSVLDSANTTISPDTVICIGNSHTLTATSTDPNSTYQWYISDSAGDLLYVADSLSNDTSWAPIATPSTTTTYACVITENACFAATRLTTVYVDPMPILSIAPPAVITAGDHANLNVIILNSPPDTGLTYEWTPPETITCPSCPLTVVTPDSNTWYHVCVTTNWGCTSCDSVKVNMVCNGDQVFIPNTFTPNGDGVNDKFIVSGKGLGLITRMTVFNRWGQVMYDAQNIPANDMTYGWDGTFQGQVLEPDVFMYVIVVTCETQGVTFKFHGDISLVR